MHGDSGSEPKLHKLLFMFGGYKIFLGSVWTDGERIATDEADKEVIVHNFTRGSVEKKCMRHGDDHEGGRFGSNNATNT